MRFGATDVNSIPLSLRAQQLSFCETKTTKPDHVLQVGNKTFTITSDDTVAYKADITKQLQCTQSEQHISIS